MVPRPPRRFSKTSPPLPKTPRALPTAGAYPAVTPVAEPRYCGRCGCGPFEALACPSCGEDDDIPRRPQGSRG